MRKVVVVALGVFVASILFAMLAVPGAPAVAQDKPDPTEDPGKSEAPSTAVLGPSLPWMLAGSCSIDCGNGDDPVTTDAGSTIECACDCAQVCGTACEATNSETGETRQCEAT